MLTHQHSQIALEADFSPSRQELGHLSTKDTQAGKTVANTAKFNIVYADPPWSFNNKNTGGSMISGASAHYPVMRVDDICKLNVPSICSGDCVLFMWWVASQPAEALAVAEAWGFTVKTMTGFNWVKETKHGKDFFGMGFWTRQGSENCLIATRGKIKPVSHSVRSVIRAKATRHSRKPDVFRDRIVELMGDLPRVELFARQKSQGWHSWGNEIDNDIRLSRKETQLSLFTNGSTHGVDKL